MLVLLHMEKNMSRQGFVKCTALGVPDSAFEKSFPADVFFPFSIYKHHQPGSVMPRYMTLNCMKATVFLLGDIARPSVEWGLVGEVGWVGWVGG